jgi:hypothetical protein
MWLTTTDGFYSAVDKGDRPGWLCVRGRVRGDLENLLALKALEGSDEGIIETGNSDYRFRVYVTREQWAAAVAEFAAAIDYSNFKDAVADRQGGERAHAYCDVWSALYRLQQR